MQTERTGEPAAEPPHPLAAALAQVVSPGTSRVLLLGAGNGRNAAPFVERRIAVDVVEADADRARVAAERFAAVPGVRVARARYAGPFPFTGPFDGALSTSALLHGTRADVAAAIAAAALRLRHGAPLYATFGSTSDPRCGEGRALAEGVWTPETGPEAGVPHAYLDRAGVLALLGAFDVDALEEGSAAQTAGRWAHAAEDAATIVHWFARARRR